MPERSPVLRWGWSRGYWPTTANIVGIPDCLLAGLNTWNRGQGLFQASKGFGNSVANSGGSVNPLLNVSDTYGGLTMGGSITQAFGDGIYWFAGAGEAFVEGMSKGVVAGGSIMIFIDGVTYQAGLLPPGMVTIDVDTGAPKKSGRCTAPVSVGITAIRTKTGAESNVSAPSNSIGFDADGNIDKGQLRRPIRITNIDSLPDGTDRLGIYGTKNGFGEIGPLFHLYDVDVTMDGMGNITSPSFPYVIKLPNDPKAGWADGQLGDLAPQEFFIPPPCGFVFVLNAVVVACGAYGGAGLSPSWPGKPEGFPVRFVMFIPGGGKVTAVKGSGIEGAVLVATGSSLNLVTAGQTDIPFVGPLNIRPIWPTTGVRSANQLCTVGGDIFAWVGTRGPVRDSFASSGDPGDSATAFAEPVMKFFDVNGYTAENCIVVYDPDSDSVFYVNKTIGIGYCRYLQQWHTPFTFPVEVVTGVTDIRNGRALFSDASGDLYQLETGTGVAWNIITQWQGEHAAAFPKTVIGARAEVSKRVRMDLFTDLDIDTPNPQATNLIADPNMGLFHHLNCQGVKVHAVGLSGDGTLDNGRGIELSGAETLEILHPVRV